METFISIFGIVMSAFTSIVVAALGLYQTKKTKETAEYRKLKDEKEDLIREKEEESRQKLNTRLDNLEQSVTSLTKEVNTLSNGVDMKKIENQLSQLHILNEVNFEYVQSLSGVVSTIGESLSSSPILSEDDKANMENKIDAHKTKESDITSKLYKITV